MFITSDYVVYIFYHFQSHLSTKQLVYFGISCGYRNVSNKQIRWSVALESNDI